MSEFPTSDNSTVAATAASGDDLARFDYYIDGKPTWFDRLLHRLVHREKP